MREILRQRFRMIEREVEKNRERLREIESLERETMRERELTRI